MHAVGPGYGRQETWVEKRLLSDRTGQDRTADDARIGLLVKFSAVVSERSANSWKPTPGKGTANCAKKE